MTNTANANLKPDFKYTHKEYQDLTVVHRLAFEAYIEDYARLQDVASVYLRENSATITVYERNIDGHAYTDTDGEVAVKVIEASVGYEFIIRGSLANGLNGN